MQVKKGLSFLNHYVDQSIEKGAQPYIADSERSGAISISSFGGQEQHETRGHGLKFEAYEAPKPPVPARVAPLSSSTELVPVPEPSYPSESHQATSASDPQLKLRLDGVQKKWGRPTYSSSASQSSASTSASQKAANGVAQDVPTGGVSSKARETYDTRKPPVEINPEKQRLAASLFGGSAKPERKPSASASHKTSSSRSVEKAQAAKAAPERTALVADLLDFSEGNVAASGATVVDPFMQLEGLLDSSSNPGGSDRSSDSPDLMGLYGDGADPAGVGNGGAGTQSSKGPSAKKSLEKDALVRQMGVNPTSDNPNLFRDLLG